MHHDSRIKKEIANNNSVREIINQFALYEGDFLEVVLLDGVINLKPVSIYSKEYVKQLERTVMIISENTTKYSEGPFSFVEEAIEYLESNHDAEVITK